MGRSFSRLDSQLFGKDLAERLDLDPFEHPLDDIGIAVRKSHRLGLAIHIDHDETAAAVSKGTRQHHLTAFNQGAQVVEMGGAHLGPQPRAVGTVMTYYDEQHSGCL